MAVTPAATGLSVFGPAHDPPAMASLLSVDPDLGHSLGPEEAPRAARALPVWVARVRAGEWQPRVGRAGDDALGLLVAEGMIVREVCGGGGCSAELLGAGDVIRPWQEDDDSALAGTATWFVADEARVAVLDGTLTAALSEWPTVAAELFGRALRRADRQATERAITQVRRVEERVLLYLWHVSERFGRVTREGIVTRIPLTHGRMAVLASMQRPSLTTALARLERSGLLVRGDDHEYVLTDAAQDAVPGLLDRLRNAA